MKRSNLVLSTILAVAAVSAPEGLAFAQGAAPAPAPADGTAAPTAPVTGGVTFGTSTPPSGTSPTADQGPTAPPTGEKPEKKPLPWHGSYLLFDQSVTTQTIGVGEDYQSSDPVYEWWFRFAPRYYFYESKVEDVSVQAWFNLYKEFTNSDSTTYRNENVIGATTLWLQYNRKLYNEHGYVTALSFAPVRLTLPTDKASRDSGEIVALGTSLGLNQTVPIQGKGASALNSFRVGVAGIYSHPFTRAKVATNGDLNRPRQDLEGASFQSDVLRGGMLAANQLIGAVTSGLQITPKLSFGASYYLLTSWAYRPQDACVQPGGASTSASFCVGDNSDAPNFRVNTWLLTSFDYDLTDEVSLSLGYYNLTNQIGPDGQRRNPIWSPDARFFFTVTGNLDAIYERIAGTSNEEATAKQQQRSNQAKADLVKLSSGQTIP